MLFLLREHARTGDADARDMVLATLRAMALGGMRDHIGGGFHRYTTDAAWRVPHFEKMLYDQSQLALAYLHAFQITHNNTYAATTRDTLDFVLREMRSPGGGFYSALDADSPLPGNSQQSGEGAYYVWSAAQVKALLGSANAPAFQYRYGV